MKNITGIYHVADCEHWCDMDSAKSFIRSLGCVITDSYWDGRDCGEAWVEFSFPECRYVAIYNKLGSSAGYSADINDYIKVSDIAGYSRVSYKELYELRNKMAEDYSAGFEERLPLWLFFEVDKWHNNPEEIISKVLSFFIEPVEVLGYNSKVVDGNKFYDVLIKSSYRNLTKGIMSNGIGDYCLGHRGWLHSQGIYGECQCVHKTFNPSVSGCWEYELLHRVIECVKKGAPLEYRNQDSYYSPKDMVVYSDLYLSSDGSFIPVLKDSVNRSYNLKDPRFWDWKKPQYRSIIVECRGK